MFTTSAPSAFPYGKYIVRNNMDANSGTSTMVVSSINPITVSWDWEYALLDGSVKSYPCITYGYSPWNSGSTDQKLPMLLSDLAPILINTNFSDTLNGSSHNVAFDIWFTSSDIPSPENIVHEVMIWVGGENYWGVEGGESVLIDGEEYTIYATTNVFTKFVKSTKSNTLSIRIDKFVEYLISIGILSNQIYIANIEFGSEVVHGNGTTTINNYQVLI